MALKKTKVCKYCGTIKKSGPKKIGISAKSHKACNHCGGLHFIFI